MESMQAEEMIERLGDDVLDNRGVSGALEQSCSLHGAHSEGGSLFELLIGELPNLETLDAEATQDLDALSPSNNITPEL